MPECISITLYPENLNLREIDRAVEVLRRGGIIIYPTDTVYGIGCDITQPKAVERIIRIKGIKPKEAHFSFICSAISQVSEFARITTPNYRLMKKNTPGPFTFILPGHHKVPNYFLSKRKTVGIRIPDNPIPLELVSRLGNPILTTSLKDNDRIIEYTTNPDRIWESHHDQVDLIINGGSGHNIPSTVIGLTEEEPVIIREGLGELIV